MEALNVAASLVLPDWCLAAGFVRNLIWDHLHGYQERTPLNDIDLIYFNKDQDGKKIDLIYEETLKLRLNLPWSVKNQARMHVRNDDQPYLSSEDAMSYWVEVETAIGATLSDGKVQLVAPFGVEVLMLKSISINHKRVKRDAFQERITSKEWLKIWPDLTVIE